MARLVIGAEAAFARLPEGAAGLKSMNPIKRAAGAKLRLIVLLLAIFPLFSYGLFAALTPFISRSKTNRHDLVQLLFTHLPWSSVAPSQAACPPAAVRPQMFSGTPPSGQKAQDKPQAGAKSGNKSRQEHKPSWSRPPAPTDPLDIRRVAISI